VAQEGEGPRRAGDRVVQIFRRHDIWARIDDNQVVCYRCFEDVRGGGFFVQSKDFFWRSGKDSLALQVQRSEAQLIDLIGREVPTRRTYSTIDEAIRAHDGTWDPM
jgi:hypothetical protein